MFTISASSPPIKLAKLTNLQLQIDGLKTRIDNLDVKTSLFEVKTNTYTDIITSSRTWTNPYNKAIDVAVRLFGGGGGGYIAISGTDQIGKCYGGGGGGYMASGTVKIAANASVSVTIGDGGAENSNGGTTSFGAYLSANGGSAGAEENGGKGGSGGGGYWASQATRGGDASYGGGGGGGGGDITNNGVIQASRIGTGGKGGTYGGGGGMSGLEFRDVTSSFDDYPNPATGGKGCGSGGKSAYYKSGQRIPMIPAGAGTNTVGKSLDFTGEGLAGGVTLPTSSESAQPDSGILGWGSSPTCSIGSGGGGGYGGNGGKGGGSKRFAGGSGYSADIASGGGGGGGGYGANGGDGGSGAQYYQDAQNPAIMLRGGGGGGGGYGGKGGNGTSNQILANSRTAYSGQGYGAGGCGGGGGGGGYGKTPVAQVRKSSGNSGICIITYTVRELVIL